MGATVFYEGSAELATLGNTFSVAGTPTDPTAVTLVVTDPTGDATTYNWPTPATITRTGAGVFTKDVPCTEAGPWQAVWTGTGAASDVETVSWYVHSTNMQSLYCSPAMLKGRKGIDDNLDDAEILSACRAVARWIDKRYCQRFFYRRTATMVFEAKDWYCLKVPDLVSVTTLKTDAAGDGTFETTWTASDYQLRPVNAPAELEPEPYTEVKAIGSLIFPVAYGAVNARSERVEIVGVWGWPAVPEPVIEAAKLLAGDYLKLGAGSFGVVGYNDYGPMRARMSAPALEMLDPYRRNPVLMA